MPAKLPVAVRNRAEEERVMRNKVIAILLAGVVVAAGVLAISNRPTTQTAEQAAAVEKTALAANSEASGSAYLYDFKAGYADGFKAGVSGISYPDQASCAGKPQAYLDGFDQGYSDGQNQQASLRDKLCPAAAASSAASSGFIPDKSRVGRARVLSQREERIDSGIGSTARKALLIAGGTALGAGIGGAIGGKKGALIGALAGGGTGTALALTGHPRRAFTRRVTTKRAVISTLAGAGAGAAIGALAGGKRGALAGAAIGGGGGALFGVLTGQRTSRR
jgi:hypothetical protein